MNTCPPFPRCYDFRLKSDGTVSLHLTDPAEMPAAIRWLCYLTAIFGAVDFLTHDITQVSNPDHPDTYISARNDAQHNEVVFEVADERGAIYSISVCR